MAAKGGEELEREYKKGNWTLEETMLLIEAKKKDRERKSKRSSTGATELRWKWIEDYCWKFGCRRSQNQCNDKWDNLMRDFKKLRKHETIMADSGEEDFSFWRLSAQEKREKGLPANFLLQVYQALDEMVERKEEEKEKAAPPILSLAQASNGPDPSIRRNSSESSPRKKRVIEKVEEEEEDGLTSAIAKSFEIIAGALMEGEDMEDARHKEILELKERRMKIGQARAETTMEAMVGLVAAVDKLARSIYKAR